MDVTVRCTLVQHFYQPSTAQDAKPHERELASVLVELSPEDPDTSQGTVNLMLTNPKLWAKFTQGKMYTVSVEPVK
jgi:hypothetical protein